MLRSTQWHVADPDLPDSGTSGHSMERLWTLVEAGLLSTAVDSGPWEQKRGSPSTHCPQDPRAPSEQADPSLTEFLVTQQPTRAPEPAGAHPWPGHPLQHSEDGLTWRSTPCPHQRGRSVLGSVRQGFCCGENVLCCGGCTFPWCNTSPPLISSCQLGVLE